MNGSDEEIPDEEDAAEFYRAQRIHVDALLDISEEAFLKEVEPYEYHCYPGWEEAVCGWDRVAPISGILLPQKRDKKPKQRKETDNPAPLHIVEPTTSCGDTLASGGEHCSRPQTSLPSLLPVIPILHTFGQFLVPICWLAAPDAFGSALLVSFSLQQSSRSP
ncbi:uncharacterized protein LOC133634023 isoform X2 [Entelurus aequoreus]|uniref:uncharacterized protein LOC133634023 isoform X2 n=1 Tax=Entelurus aequoreus TaxID=161455 RepID=UPI002B1D4BBC|nr:uncharacterized protein LOC133634023 isoform X2 [Entelurus aequoreus]